MPNFFQQWMNAAIQIAEDELKARGEVCPQCGRQEWTLGYPMGTTTGFVKF